MVIAVLALIAAGVQENDEPIVSAPGVTEGRLQIVPPCTSCSVALLCGRGLRN